LRHGPFIVSAGTAGSIRDESTPQLEGSVTSVRSESSVVGQRRPRIDGRDKVTGTTRYGADLPRHDLLHARIVPSHYAHARIRSIDTSDALDVPGVVAVLVARDLPIVGQGMARRYEPLARDEAVFVGQPLALVVAESEAAAEDAVGRVTLDLEPLEPAVDVMAAAAPGAPPAWTLREWNDSVAADEDGSSRSPNVFSSIHEVHADGARAFDRCAAIVEGRFRTSWAYQAYLEPHVATAAIEADGTLAVDTSTQGIFWARNELAKIFGLPMSKVRVTGSEVGGAFGSKQIVVEPLVAGAALKLRRPVRLVLTRQEDVAATRPAQGVVIDLRIGAEQDGTFAALEADLTYDAGAFPESSMHWFASQLVAGPYRWPAWEVAARGVRTNKVGVGPYRAPTGPQGVFALETLVDELAARLAIDPIALRSQNLVRDGDATADGETWPDIGAAECLDRLGAHDLWSRRSSLPPGEGVGLALAVWLGSTEPAAATCRLEPDGTITVMTGIADISGARGGLAVIAAETFGLPVDAVTVTALDTGSAPPSPASNGSAITYSSGLAVERAAADARTQFLAFAAESFEIAADDLTIVDGVVRPRGTPATGRSVAELAAELADSYQPPCEGHARIAHAAMAPSAAGHVAHVRVDEETGTVELLGYAVVQDVGRALDAALVEDQMLGGTVQSIGRALLEELVHDEWGQLLTGSFLDYAVPRAAGLPPIETLIVEFPAPEGPLGARGAGEASIVPGPAAIANAIAAATDVRMRELPMTAQRIWRALADRRRAT
jgi:CO/xanthine dehydrogenase Mo-binding subunit